MAALSAARVWAIRRDRQKRALSSRTKVLSLLK
jgi:hypothetical protein